MEWKSERITELTWKYIKGELSPGDRQELDAWLSDPYNRVRFEERVKTENIFEGVMFWEMAKEEPPVTGWNRGQEVGSAKIVSMGEIIERDNRRGWWVAAAVTVAVFAGAGLWWNGFKNDNKTRVNVIAKANALPPGSNKAVLILGDGKTVSLDDAGKGTIARQGGSDAVKLDGGELAYHSSSVAAPVMNTIATPRGGSYRVILPDGTKVWLNAASKIKFPTAFTGLDRQVTLDGEAYVEVAADAGHPFIVNSGYTRVRVLGTSFDLMAYPDEGGVKTSLATGKVEVSAGQDKVMLKPNEQAQMRDGKLTVSQCDIGQVLAWKHGFLDFRGADIRTVMRAVGRWWDVDVLFSGAVSPERFTGQLGKSLRGQEALEILTASGYHFNIVGKTITVLP